MATEADIRVADLERRLLGGYQLLQALIGIRLRAVRDPESRRHLAWLSDVTAAMSLFNRRAVQEGPVDFASYLDDAIAFWRRSCEGRPIRFEVRAASAVLPDSQALTLAIIAHELISNAVRHGFPGEGRGAIAVAFSRSAEGISLVIRDSGIGAGELAAGDGLGLVEGLVDHMQGSMTVETSPGAGVGVRVRLPTAPTSAH
ncbi:hypothetical protein ASG17_10105 [Brevundimonas sp. Leaf363]|uniref:sensor histidine kinase n=1 Tax=Brevundimonas sp. Leaf363 TaxID=1736353 RepID=UPI0006F5D3C6|nr:sensor histidine kinase [Brevundimonas sp. Leaf363]KQS56342.1 hypothetical protein ASG17_10105 [Brevundimonas sp. Leaf363]